MIHIHGIDPAQQTSKPLTLEMSQAVTRSLAATRSKECTWRKQDIRTHPDQTSPHKGSAGDHAYLPYWAHLLRAWPRRTRSPRHEPWAASRAT
jgi:hypothetical protein